MINSIQSPIIITFVATITNNGNLSLYSNKIAKKKLQHFRNMQRIAKQDQELKEFIGKTEVVLLQSETQVQYCQEDIRSLEERLLLWSSTLERIEDTTPRDTESSMSQTEASSRVSRNSSVAGISNIDETDISDCRSWPKFV